jgi:fatty-acyl-CoA synthase
MVWGVPPSALPIIAKQGLRGATGPATLIRISAATQPDREALISDARRLTFRDLDTRVDRLAAGLHRHHGLRRGDSAVLVMHNRGELLEAQAAMSRIGGGAVSVSWRSTEDELEYLVDHSGARAVIVESSVADATLAIRDRLPRVPRENYIGVGARRAGLVDYEHVLQGGAAAVDEAAEPGAVIIYTSGTTGKPKGAVRRFPREMQDAVLRLLLETPIHHDDRHLVVCPMYHSTAFGFIGFTMAVGGTVVIAPRFEPEAFLALVERERITTTAVVPTMLHRILELPDEVIGKYDTSTLRGVFSGGAPLSGTLARRFMERFGEVLFNFYGATETGVNTLATPAELLASPGTIGHAIDGNEIVLLDEDGNAVKPGETGELWVKNAMLVAGYHRDDDATRASMREGYFSVGDLAHVDSRGLFHIDGRKRDMIISGGVNVYPAEVEETLSRHPAIAEASVIGMPDEEWGERVRAFVRLTDGQTVSAEDVIAFAREHLAGPKCPRDVVFLDELPKNPTGKVLKRELRRYGS